MPLDFFIFFLNYRVYSQSTLVWSFYPNLRVFLHSKLAPLDTGFWSYLSTSEYWVINEYPTSTQIISKTRCNCSWYTNFSKNVKLKLINTFFFFWKLLQIKTKCKMHDCSMHLYLQFHSHLVLIIAQNSTIEYFRVLIF